MNLIKFTHKEDFGHDWFVQVLNVKGWSLLQASVSWNDYPGWPFLQISFGSNGLMSVLFWVYKFGFCVDVLSRTWNWDYMNKIEEEQ